MRGPEPRRAMDDTDTHGRTREDGVDGVDGENDRLGRWACTRWKDHGEPRDYAEDAHRVAVYGIASSKLSAAELMQ